MQKNVLFITHYQELYGANKSLINLLTGLNKEKYNLLVICPWTGEMTDFLNDNGLQNIGGRYFSVWCYRNKRDLLKTPYRFSKSLYSLARVYRQIEEFKPDIIYSNSSVIWTGMLLSAVLKKPHVWHIREFGDKDYGYKLLGGKTVFNYLMNSSAAVIAISRAIDKETLSLVKPEKRYQIYDGIVTESEIAEQPKQRETTREFTFCMIGVLIASKGYEEGIKAMELVLRQYPDAQLLIAGKGMLNDRHEESLHLLVSRLKLQSNVRFMGYLEDARDIYHQSDSLLMCSKSEGLGRVTVEAMAHGLPVIGKKSGATPEVVIDGYNGYLYAKGPDELADCMLRMIRNNAYTAFSENAITTVKKNFTVEEYSKKIEKVLEAIS